MSSREFRIDLADMADSDNFCQGALLPQSPYRLHLRDQSEAGELPILQAHEHAREL
jgi:hypothetical protein